MRPAVHSDGGLAQVFRHRDHRRCSRNSTSVTPAVDLDARYGLAALEKSLTAGE
ncbi:hypothetical protein N806_11245 [Rhodococcus sp. P27]|nr:hypothetical protein N806_11245 [Rhodococcus sp. P27]